MRHRVLAVLGEAPTAAERLAEAARVPLAETLATLTGLELLGLARSHAGNRYSQPVPKPRRERSNRVERKR